MKRCLLAGENGWGLCSNFGRQMPFNAKSDLLFFFAPQFNTRIELTCHQNEKGILDYAQSMLDHGLPPGVLMIDDTWQLDYGTLALR